MSKKLKKSFEETLKAVGPRNIQSLEVKARTASSLALMYPENAAVLRAIESAAIRQMASILFRVRRREDTRMAANSGDNEGPTSARLAAD